MLWEQEQQASVSTAFSSPPKRPRVIETLVKVWELIHRVDNVELITNLVQTGGFAPLLN